MKYSELVAIENLIENSLHNINQLLGIGRVNDWLEVNKEPQPTDIQIIGNRILFGTIVEQLFKFWVQTQDAVIQIIKDLVDQNSAKAEEIEILQEQIKTLTDGLMAESQRADFWQEEVDFCNQEIEALNIELQSSTLLLESLPLESQLNAEISNSPKFQQQAAKIRHNCESSKTSPKVLGKTIAKRKFSFRRTSVLF